jgi:DNA-binding response OmpR family regulator
MEGSRNHVLVVDDDENLTTLYQVALGAEGYRVSVANTGHEALEEVRRDRPDLIVMDIRIPDIDGLELMNRILAADPDIRIVINSGYACYRDSFLSWSADAYLLKSTDLGPLLHEVERLARPRRTQLRGSVATGAGRLHAAAARR